MPVRRLKNLLNTQNVKYVTISHSPAFTAQKTAASAHIPGKELAKTVMVKIDGKMAMAVLPASSRLDFGLLKAAAGAHEVGLATEEEFKDTFPECDVGAMPPFGNLYGMRPRLPARGGQLRLERTLKRTECFLFVLVSLELRRWTSGSPTWSRDGTRSFRGC